MHIRKFQVATVVFLAAAAAGCSRGDKPKGRAREDAPKSRKGRNRSPGLRQPLGRDRRDARRRRPGDHRVTGRRRGQAACCWPTSATALQIRTGAHRTRSRETAVQPRQPEGRSRARPGEVRSDRCHQPSAGREDPRRAEGHGGTESGARGVRPRAGAHQTRTAPEAIARGRRHDPPLETGGVRFRLSRTPGTSPQISTSSNAMGSSWPIGSFAMRASAPRSTGTCKSVSSLSATSSRARPR